MAICAQDFFFLILVFNHKVCKGTCSNIYNIKHLLFQEGMSAKSPFFPFSSEWKGWKVWASFLVFGWQCKLLQYYTFELWSPMGWNARPQQKFRTRIGFLPKLFLPSPHGEIARPTIGLGLASQAHRSVHQMNYPSKKKSNELSHASLYKLL